jgi:hypothetical protein
MLRRLRQGGSADFHNVSMNRHPAFPVIVEDASAYSAKPSKRYECLALILSFVTSIICLAIHDKFKPVNPPELLLKEPHCLTQDRDHSYDPLS